MIIPNVKKQLRKRSVRATDSVAYHTINITKYNLLSVRPSNKTLIFNILIIINALNVI